MVKDFGFSKSTINFKINLIKLIDKYLNLKKSSLPLKFFKDYAKTIKEAQKEKRSVHFCFGLDRSLMNSRYFHYLSQLLFYATKNCF